MPKFKVNIREATVEASSARTAALETAVIIAFAHTIHIYEVTDEDGKTETIELTPAEIEMAAKEGQNIRDRIK